jgi:hypothetical protein
MSSTSPIPPQQSADVIAATTINPNGKAPQAVPQQAAPSQQSDNAYTDTTSKPNGKAPSPVQPAASDDPFAASNFAAAGEEVPTSVDDMEIELGAPSDEEFVFVSSDPHHYVKGSLLVVSREDGYGKSYFLLTPSVILWAKQQPSLKKFVKVMHIFLYKVNEGGFGLWLVRDSLDNWSVSDLQVVNQAKKVFTRRFTDGKVRKGHSSDAIDTAEVVFPDKPLVGSDGLLKQAFGEAFVITTIDHPIINRLLGR